MTETVTAPASISEGTAGSKSEQAYQAIKARIVEGTYTPGYRLVLAAIAKDLGFSVVPVREAIRRLEAEGLVKFERNIGATVSGIDPTEYLYTMQTLSIVEGAATALSAPLVGEADIARARAVNAEMRECLQHFDPSASPGSTRTSTASCSSTAPTRTFWILSTAAGTGWHHCGPQPSALFPAGPTNPWTNTRPCSGSLNPVPTPTPSKSSTTPPQRHPGRIPLPSKKPVRTSTMTTPVETATKHYVPENLPTHIQHFINGKFVDSVGGKTFDVLDPVSNKNYATAAAGQKEDIDLAVAAAREAFTSGPWPKMKPRERAKVLNRIADAVEAQEARLAELETFDTGLPITQAKGQALRAAENFRFFADLIVAQFDDAMKVPAHRSTT